MGRVEDSQLESHQRILHNLLAEYRDWYTQIDDPGVETQIVSDDTNGQYMFLRVGWRGETRLSRPLFYVRLKNGKIWIEEDWTQEGIASELVAAGVPHHDIVLAFNPPEVRHLTEFAVA